MSEPVPLFGGLHVAPIQVHGKLLSQTLSHDSGLDIEFRVESLRNSPTGVHGKASVYQLLPDNGEVFIQSDHFNIERSEERQRLANRAYKRLNSAGPTCFGDAERFNVLFDNFCVSAWPTSIEQVKGGWRTPSAVVTEVQTLTPFIMHSGGTIMFAAPGSGKTFLGLMCAYSVQYGIDTLFPVKQAQVLYVNLERSASSMDRRLTMVCAALGLPPSRLLMLNRRGASITDVEDAIADMVAEHNVQLVIVDSLSRFGGGSLNDDNVMNKAMDLLNRVAPTWLLIAHSPRADSSHAFGSVMQDAAADVMLQVASERLHDLTVGVALAITKANDIPEGPVGTYAMTFDRAFGLTGIRKARSGEFIVLEGAEADRRPAKQRIVAYLQEQGDASAEDLTLALHLSRTTVTNAFADSNTFTRTVRDGKRQKYGLRSFHEEPA